MSHLNFISSRVNVDSGLGLDVIVISECGENISNLESSIPEEKAKELLHCTQCAEDESNNVPSPRENIVAA